MAHYYKPMHFKKQLAGWDAYAILLIIEIHGLKDCIRKAGWQIVVM